MSLTDDNQPDDGLSPSMNLTSLKNRPEPGVSGEQMDVSQDLQNVGHPTNEPRDDSPESLDQEVAQGANREDIAPHHSIDRSDIDNIDKEEHGVN